MHVELILGLRNIAFCLVSGLWALATHVSDDVLCASELGKISGYHHGKKQRYLQKLDDGAVLPADRQADASWRSALQASQFSPSTGASSRHPRMSLS